MKNRGFTIIEIMVACVIVAIIIMGAIPILAGSQLTGKVTWGVNGATESRCIEGYKFVMDQTGNARQILDEFGKGVKCYANPEPGKPGSFGSM